MPAGPAAGDPCPRPRPAAGGARGKARKHKLGMSLPDYIRSLTVTQGAGAGGPFRLLPWQSRFLRGAFAVPGDSAISVARGNGKSALVAAVASAVVDGPLRQPRSEVVCVASSFAQGRIIFEHVLAFLAARGVPIRDRSLWRVQDSQNVATIEHRATGARVRCIGSDPKRAHGLAPLFVLADEPAQWESAKRDAMLAALRTSMGKIEGSRLIALGTRPASEEHFFSRMLAGGCDYWQVHAAGKDDPPFRLRTWRKANPSLAVMPALEARIRMEAADARRDDALRASFDALRLNLGTDDVGVETLLAAGTWKRIEGDVPRAGRCVWGLDLGQSEAMSAAAAYWPTTGRLEALASFPREPGLADRGAADGVGGLYERMAGRCELVLTGGEAVSIEEFVSLAMERFGRPEALAADRWRAAELRDILRKLGLRIELAERGQGFKDGGEDVRDFRRAAVEGKVRPAPSLLLRAAMSEARTVSDPAGNAKLAKSSEGGRRRRAKDDAAAAAILAVALGARKAARPQRGWRYAVAS